MKSFHLVKYPFSKKKIFFYEDLLILICKESKDFNNFIINIYIIIIFEFNFDLFYNYFILKIRKYDIYIEKYNNKVLKILHRKNMTNQINLIKRLF